MEEEESGANSIIGSAIWMILDRGEDEDEGEGALPPANLGHFAVHFYPKKCKKTGPNGVQTGSIPLIAVCPSPPQPPAHAAMLQMMNESIGEGVASKYCYHLLVGRRGIHPSPHFQTTHLPPQLSNLFSRHPALHPAF
jgi:hypothetical protein